MVVVDVVTFDDSLGTAVGAVERDMAGTEWRREEQSTAPALTTRNNGQRARTAGAAGKSRLVQR